MPTNTYYEDSTKPLGALIQEWRASLHLTRAGAADALGVPLPTLHAWIAGRTCAHPRAIRKLMSYIAVDFSDKSGSQSPRAR